RGCCRRWPDPPERASARLSRPGRRARIGTPMQTRWNPLLALLLTIVILAATMGCGDAGSTNHGHDAGAGDPCSPNPCTAEHRTVCAPVNGVVVCHCDPGTHESDDGCAPDETCMQTTCGGHGACSVVAGAPACMCDPGYEGDFCQDCDTAAGYVSDGNGGCTN